MKKVLGFIIFICFACTNTQAQIFTKNIYEKAISAALEQNIEAERVDKIKSISNIDFQKDESVVKAQLKTFAQELTQIVSVDEFSLMFPSEIKSFSEEILAEKRIKFLSGKYELSEQQKKIVKERIIKEHVKESVYTLYYSYDYNTAQKFINSVKYDNLQNIKSFIDSNFQEKLEEENLIKQFIKKAEFINLRENKIDSIKSYLNIYKEKLIQAKYENKTRIDKEFLTFNSFKATKEQLKNSLQRKVKLLLTFEEFKKMFRNQFEVETKEAQEIEFKRYTKGLSLNKDQKERLKTVINYHAENVVIARKYYKNENEAWKKILAKRNQKKENIEDAIKGLGLKTLSDLEKEETFKEACSKAEIPKSNIEAIFKAVYQKEKTLRKFERKNEDLNKENLIVLDDVRYKSKKEIKNVFKKSLASNLTLDQFGIVFKDQLLKACQYLIDNQVRTFKSTYDFGESKNDSIIELINNQAFKETLLKEYYSYDHKLMTQKLRASQYRFEKMYSKKIREFQGSN